MPMFEVVVTRTTRESASVEVTAKNEEEAEALVKKQVLDSSSSVDWEVDDEDLDFDVDELADETEPDVD